MISIIGVIIMSIPAKLLCCILVILALTGCAQKEDGSSEDVSSTFDYETAKDYAIIIFDFHHWQVENAEGKEVHWSRHPTNKYLIPILEGDMEHRGRAGADFWTNFITEYSEHFTVQTRLPMPNDTTHFTAAFYKGGMCVSDLLVSGGFEGTATLFADNSIELNGVNLNFSAEFTVLEEGEPQYRYVLSGTGEKQVKLKLVDEEIAAEGMVGEYTVTKYNSEGEEISVETFQGKEPASDS